MILVLVEFLALGHAAQQREHAALPKQQASCEPRAIGRVIREPMVVYDQCPWLK